jgi:hypothetical protein
MRRKARQQATDLICRMMPLVATMVGQAHVLFSMRRKARQQAKDLICRMMHLVAPMVGQANVLFSLRRKARPQATDLICRMSLSIEGQGLVQDKSLDLAFVETLS